jgi:hypothetical protein
MKLIDYLRELFYAMLAMFKRAPLLELEPPPVAIVRTRKRRDTTKFTQYHFDYIMRAHRELKEYNATAKPGQRKSVSEMVSELNAEFGMDKSSACMGNVWNGKIKRHELAVGISAYLQ